MAKDKDLKTICVGDTVSIAGHPLGLESNLFEVVGFNGGWVEIECKLYGMRISRASKFLKLVG
ncbi:hypothetical protein [uncultured Mediterranean phage uvMED]|nr:hypothetical protein [uncultured Mediterranean phage uvMED]